MSDMDLLAAARALLEPLTGYTPGPWWTSGKYSGHQMGCSIIAANPSAGPAPGNPTRGQVAFATAILNTDARRCEANARLIVAAPDLRDMVATLADALEVERADNQRLRKIIEKMDEHSPRADHTCEEPGITLSEAVMRAWPELAEPKGEVSE